MVAGTNERELGKRFERLEQAQEHFGYDEEKRALGEELVEKDAALACYRRAWATLEAEHGAFRDDIDALLRSRRWRLGDLLLSLPSRLFRRRPKTVADSLRDRIASPSAAQAPPWANPRRAATRPPSASGMERGADPAAREAVLVVEPETISGGVDVTHRLQAILDTVPERPRTVSIPAGRYCVGTIRIPSNTVIQGAADGDTVLQLLPGTNDHLLTNADHQGGNHNIEIRRLTLLGTAADQSRSTGDDRVNFCSAVYFNRVTHARLTDLRVCDARQAATHFTRCDDILLDRLSCRRIGWSGVSTSGTFRIVVANTRIVDSGRDDVHSAIHLDGGGDAVVQCTIRECTGHGIMLDSEFAPFDGVVVSADIDHCRCGIAVRGHRNHELGNVLVRQCAIADNATGIDLTNAKHVVVDGSVVRRSERRGLSFHGHRPCTDVVVTNTTFEGNGQDVGGTDRVVRGHFLGNDPPETNALGGLGEMAEVEYDHAGTCSVCGRQTVFAHTGGSIRESFRCAQCRASLRQRGQAYAVVDLYAEDAQCLEALCREPGFRALRVYEPGLAGPFREYLAGLPHYVQSYYWDDLALGETRDGIVNQDLQSLTFQDGSFDLVITSDLMEHVRRPYAGFAEIRRVLKVGGRHVFTIPVAVPMASKTVSRVDTTTDTDIPLLPARYHIAGDGGRSLVYTDFGKDLLADLREIGFETSVHIDTGVPTGPPCLTFVCKKTEGSPTT